MTGWGLERMMCGGAFCVRFETSKKSDGHVLDSYKTLYLDLVAQLVERLASVDTGVSRLL